MNDDSVYFAKTNFRGQDRIFGIRNSDRRQHFYIVGKSGTGKTTLLANMAIQDIQNGKGVAIVDAHGDFVEEVVKRIPEERANDTIYFNPADMDSPIGFNVLEVADPQYKHLVASDLMGIFTKIWSNVWSARMEYILNNCVLALLDTPGTTLLGITRILVDLDYRKKIIENIKDPVVKAFWTQEFETWRDQFRNEAIVPIQNKVGQFLSTPLVRNIVGQSKSTLNIGEVMNSGKILLMNVAKGRIGEDNAGLLGAMLITKIQLAAMERVRIPEEERKDFYLYVDEFQTFATDSFASILSEARKYRLNLIVAHQYIGQLVTDTSTRVRDAIFGNVGTMVAFRVGAADAEFLEKEFEPEFVIQDLVNLPNRNIYLKLMVNGITSRPFSATTLPPLEFALKEADKGKIVEISRRLYGKSREKVEAQIKNWSETGIGEFDGENSTFSQNTSRSGQEISEKNQAVCWVCGRETEVKFKPEKGRPVYCVNCLKKIEKGEISPINLPKLKKEKDKKFSDTLGQLGIEFSYGGTEQGGVKKAEPKYKAETSRRPAFPSDIKKGSFVLKENPSLKKQISLKELKTRRYFFSEGMLFKKEKKESHKDPQKIAELRETIKEALKNVSPSVLSGEYNEKGNSREGGIEQTKYSVQEQKKILPGDTIKFE